MASRHARPSANTFSNFMSSNKLLAPRIGHMCGADTIWGATSVVCRGCVHKGPRGSPTSSWTRRVVCQKHRLVVERDGQVRAQLVAIA
eukprot:6043395-Pyramimonas_sp.AAC.1